MPTTVHPDVRLAAFVRTEVRRCTISDRQLPSAPQLIAVAVLTVVCAALFTNTWRASTFVLLVVPAAAVVVHTMILAYHQVQASSAHERLRCLVASTEAHGADNLSPPAVIEAFCDLGADPVTQPLARDLLERYFAYGAVTVLGRAATDCGPITDMHLARWGYTADTFRAALLRVSSQRGNAVFVAFPAAVTQTGIFASHEHAKSVAFAHLTETLVLLDTLERSVGAGEVFDTLLADAVGAPLAAKVWAMAYAATAVGSFELI